MRIVLILVSYKVCFNYLSITIKLNIIIKGPLCFTKLLRESSGSLAAASINASSIVLFETRRDK